MKFLYINCRNKWEKSIQDAFLEEKQEIQYFNFPEPISTFDFVTLNQEVLEALAKTLQKREYDVVFSISYLSDVSMLCNILGVIYISWIIDFPNADLYRRSIWNPCNCFFLSDNQKVKEFTELGIENVYYLPSAAANAMEGDIHDQYHIGLLEALYTDMDTEHDIWTKVLSDSCRGYLDGMIHSQRVVYGTKIINNNIPNHFLKELEENYPYKIPEDVYLSKNSLYAEKILIPRISRLERNVFISKLAEGFIWSSKWQGKRLFPVTYADYPQNDMERQTFIGNAKINLNITNRYFSSGISRHAFEIMGYSGFLLTNNQLDFLSFFEPDVDFVYFEDETDLLKKATFYVNHKDERRKIAHSGYEKIKEAHLYTHRIKYLISNL